MSFDLAVRFTEMALALAFIQQSAEHFMAAREERRLFMLRAILSALLLLGVQTPWVCLALVVHGLCVLRRFQGPYNGGSDRIGLLIVCCLCAVHFMPTLQWQEYMFGYLAVQAILSYFVAGWVKIVNPEWRSGQALCDVFLFSAYPVSETLRGWAHSPRLLCFMSWCVMLFEVLFPLTLLTHTALALGLSVAALFHFANACLFGLNRFFWFWLAVYPSILWLQQRIVGM